VQPQKNAVLVARPAQLAQETLIGGPDAAFALDGLDDDARRLRSDGVTNGVHVVEGDVVESLDHRTEALQIFGIPRGGESGERPAVERALETDDPISFRPAGFGHG